MVREPKGILRRANREERYRMNQIYFPQEDRFGHMPHMFQDENLAVKFPIQMHMNDLLYPQAILERGDYLFILEEACIHFEPDDPQFISITHQTYNHINEKRAYSCLLSTRHYGPFVFHLCLENNIDYLLQNYINHRKIRDATTITKLYILIHPEKESIDLSEKEDLDIIEVSIISM